jgi:hypothetical protein
MPVRCACIIATTLWLLGSAPAPAQWNPSFTASLGRGYGNIALSQSILSNTRANSRSAGSGADGNGAPDKGAATSGTGTASGFGAAANAATASGSASAPDSARGPPSLAADARGTPTLTYIPDQAVSDRMREQTIDALSRTLPQLRAQMEQSFAGNAVLKEFDHRMSTRGYSSHDVADDMAELLLVSWEITTGGAAQGAQVQGAHRQVRDIFLGNSRLRAMTNAERQEMAERIAYQVVISSSAHKEYLRSGDRAQLAGLQQAVATMLRQQGIDLTNLRLTPQGFHR